MRSESLFLCRFSFRFRLCVDNFSAMINAVLWGVHETETESHIWPMRNGIDSLWILSIFHLPSMPKIQNIQKWQQHANEFFFPLNYCMRNSQFLNYFYDTHAHTDTKKKIRSTERTNTNLVSRTCTHFRRVCDFLCWKYVIHRQLSKWQLVCLDSGRIH